MTNLKIKLWKDKAFLNGDFGRLRSIAMELPGFRKFVDDSLLFEPSGKNIEHLAKIEGIEWDEASKKFCDDHFARTKREEVTRLMKDAALPEQIYDFVYKTTPFDHQKRAFLLSKDEEYYAYLMEMGTGKTKVVIDNAAYLYSKDLVQCLIIVAPNGVHAQWINEQLPVHMPDWVDRHEAIYKASSKPAMKAVNDLLDKKQGLKVVAFNIESFSNKKGVETIRKFLEKFDCMLALDESTRIKTPGSLRTKSALKLAPLAKYRRLMSGAPVTKGYEDLYAQLKFLHPDILGFSSFYTFRNYHCIMGGFEQRQIVGYRPNAIKELESKIEAYSFRVTKKECLDLPDKIYVKRYVELTEEQERIYSGLDKDLIVQIDGEDLNIELALTQLLRMQQVVCGHITVGEQESQETKSLPTNRVSVLLECIEEAAGKVIVWSRFTYDIKAIEKALIAAKIGHVLYYGQVGGDQRVKNIEQFREDPNCKVFLAQPASGGTGLNLAVASTVIYFSNDFNADTRWQSEDRAHRIGQKNSVTYIDLIAKGTIDEKITKALMEKKNLADSLLDNPRLFLREEHANKA